MGLSNENRIMFSVIFPTYGVEAYLPDAIGDILGQTYRELELLIVDDASPDHSGAIADEAAARDSRVHVIHLPENGGVSGARNRGLAEAKGDYCLFLDPDDRFDPDLLDTVREAVAVYHEPDVILYGLTEDYFDLKGEKVYSIVHTPPGQYFSSTEELRKILMPLEEATLYGYPWNKAYRTAFLKENGFSFPKIPHIEDVLFNADVFDRARSLVTLDRQPVHYRNVLSEERKTRLTAGHIDEYFDLQKRRVQRLLGQQRAFGTLDAEAYRILSAEYFRSFSSGISRDLSEGMKKKSLLEKVRNEMETDLFLELAPRFIPAGRAMKFLMQPLADGKTKIAVRRAGLVAFVKKHFPGLFAKLKQER